MSTFFAVVAAVAIVWAFVVHDVFRWRQRYGGAEYVHTLTLLFAYGGVIAAVLALGACAAERWN